MARVIKLPGGSSLTLNTTELLVKVRVQANLALDQIVKDAERRIKEAMTGEGKSGRRYRIGTARRRRFHIASAPGEPPARRSGRLASSVKSGVRTTGFGIEGVVGTNVVYSVFLEAGTSRMAPRPIWGRVLRESTDEIIRFFEQFAT